MRTKAIIAALLLVGSVLPSVGARHLSAGYEDTIGMGAEETPDDPTVPEEDYQRGATADGCYESEGNVSAEAASRAMAGDAFCGELVYHQGTELEQTGPADQQLLADGIGAFDVHVANYMGTAIERWNQPFVDPVWQGIHEAGQALGLTDSAGHADDQDGDRTQAYHVAVHYPFATHVVQEHTGAWEMNGPMSQEPYQAFVGFLYDDEGNPISGEQLEQMIADAELPDSAIPAICGFEPFGNFAAINNIGSCGIELTYFGPEDSDDFRGYEDECESPAYVCNPMAGGAWHGRIQCPATCTGNSEFNYEIMHWVAAPVLEQECNGQAPGFAIEPKEGYSLPYLAHDLDVYSPTASAVEEASFPTTWTWANDATDTVTDEVTDQADEVISEIPDLPGGPDLSSVDEAQTLYTKPERVEPNAEPAGALSETSQSLQGDEDLKRSLTQCQALTSSEDTDTVDPWVDIVDGQVNLGVTGERSGSGLENFVGLDLAGFGTGSDGLYLTSADHQDSSNRPGPGTMWTEGKVGMFTDKNDDGDYDQEFLGSKYQVDEIEETGAYPMLWDMWVDENGDPQPGQGCTAVGGATHTEMMVDAGYGPNTGLAQHIYMTEPTVFVEPASGETIPYTAGNTIFVLGSNAVHEMWSPENPSASDLSQELSSAIVDLRAWVDANNGDEGQPDIVMPGEDFGLDSDFETQCREPTGGFTSSLSFLHDCRVDCSADTIATVYTFEVERQDGTLGGGPNLGEPPVFSTEETDAYDFGQGQHTWVDVDPFDNDPDRNKQTSSAPPTGE